MSSNFFKVPACFSDSLYLEKLNQLNKRYNDSACVVETYGSLPSSLLGNAFPGEILPNLNLNKLESYIIESASYGIEFNYTMNAIWSNGVELDVDNRELVYRAIEELVDIGVRHFTVASPFLIDFFYYNFPDITLDISINLDTSSYRKFVRWERYPHIRHVIIPRHLNREFHLLRKFAQNNVISCELLVNSICNYHCISHNYHNLINSCSSVEGNQIHYESNILSLQCLCNQLENHNELICANWIRPEDVKEYVKLGINYFKIDGRAAESVMILPIVEMYLRAHHDGNFFDIVAYHPDKQDLLKFYLDNRTLDGYLIPFIHGEYNCLYCDGKNPYCQTYAQKIVSQNPNLNAHVLRAYNYKIKDSFTRRK